MQTIHNRKPQCSPHGCNTRNGSSPKDSHLPLAYADSTFCAYCFGTSVLCSVLGSGVRGGRQPPFEGRRTPRFGPAQKHALAYASGPESAFMLKSVGPGLGDRDGLKPLALLDP